jgi:glycosyltransferase involved in cell wall biosynthesis
VIAYFSAGEFIGGAERSLALLVHEVAKRRKIVVFANSKTQALFQGVNIEVTEWPYITLSRKTFAQFLWQSLSISRKLRKMGVTTVHANDFRSLYGCWLAARLATRPLVAHNRNLWDIDDFSWKERLAIRATNQIVCISRAVENNLRHLLPLHNTTVVYNAIDANAFHRARATTAISREKLGWHAENFIVGMASRVSPDKEQHLLVEAARSLVPSIPTIRFLIVGATDGIGAEYFDGLRKLLHDYRLTDRFLFTGHVENPAPFINLMDVFVLTSRCEAFGRVLIEAMALGKPIVAANSGGVPEIVVHGENGLLFAPGSAEELMRHINHLYKHPIEREELGKAGEQTCRNRFTLTKHVASIEAIYQKFA